MIMQKCLLVAVFFINSILDLGNTIGLNGFWTVQDLIQTQSCSDIVGPLSNSCCLTCLGFSPVEYNALASVGTFTGIPVVLLSGFLIDRFGMAPFAAVFSVSGVVGNSLRLAASLSRSNHSVAFVLMLIGESLFQWSHMAMYIVRYYVAQHFFSNQVRPFAMGFATGLNYAIGLVAFWTLNGIGHRHGLPAIFELFTALSLLAPTCVAAIIVIDKFIEKPYRSIDEADNDLPSIFKSVGREMIDGRALIIVIACGLSGGVIVSFDVNAINFLIDRFGISSEDAAFYTGVGLLMCAIFCPITGLVAGRLNASIHLIAVGGGVMTAGFLLLLVTHVHPAIGIGMIGFGVASTLPVSYSLLAEFVPNSIYGTVASMTSVLRTVTICVLTELTGVFVQFMSSRMLGWIISYVCHAGLTTSICGIGVVLLMTRETKQATPND